MKIIIASKNPNKVEAVKETFAEYEYSDLVVTSVEALNAPEQPIGMDAICAGAKGRAEEVFSACDLSVGIESGVTTLGNGKMIDFCMCSIYDGERHYVGSSGGFEIPSKIIDHINKGIKLSDAAKLAGFTNNENLGHSEGIIGILSKGKINRKKYTKQAIEMALVYYNNQEMYE